MKNIRREDWESLEPTVYGWGINDVNYDVTVSFTKNNIKSIVWICPYYEDWRKVIQRCFDVTVLQSRPSYSDCTICEEWKYLSNFIKWVDSQPNRDWENCHLDKDILFNNNKCYSPENCAYIPQRLNSFIVDSKGSRGGYMLGVSDTGNISKPYMSRVNNPFSKGKAYLGVFATELEAHKAWQAKKHEYACQLADLQQDPRVAKALRERYAPDKDWTER